MLNTEEAQEIRNIAHHMNLFNFSLGEITLSDNNIKMFSAYWCPHCHDQKQLFGKKAVKELSIIECAQDGKDNQYKLCREKQIEGFPSWEINGEIYSGVKDLNDLAIMTEYNGDSNF